MLQDLLKINEVRAFLLEGEVIDVLREALEKQSLDSTRYAELLDLCDAVIDRTASPKQMPQLIAAAFGISEEQAKSLAIAVAGHRLLPIEQYIPGLKAQFLAWGGQLSDFPSRRIEKDRALTELLVERLLEEQGVQLEDSLRKRLVYLAGGFLGKDRAKEPTLALMQRPSNLGGLAISKEAAERVLDAIVKAREEFDALQKEEEKTAVEHLEVPEATPEEVSEPITEPVELLTKDDLFAYAETLQDDADIVAKQVQAIGEAIEKPTLTVVELLEWAKWLQDDEDEPVLPPHSENEPLPAIRQPSVVSTRMPIVAGDLISQDEKKEVEDHELMLAFSGSVEEDDAQKKMREEKVNVLLQEATPYFKAKNLTGAQFKDAAEGHVRGRRELIRTLELLKEKFGFNDVEVEEIVAIFERAREIALRMDEKPAMRVVENSAVDAKALREKEQELLNKRHAELTGKISNESIESTPVVTQVSAARTKVDEIALQEAKINTERVKKAEIASKPPKAATKLSVQSTPPQTGKLTDITFARTLKGPVDELRAMTSVEFRRLSSDPVEATRKIEDKLALLQETTYEERIKGVRAWRDSAVNKLYLEMAREALQNGQSFAEVGATRRNAGKESLSPAEASAIMAFNRRIKF